MRNITCLLLAGVPAGLCLAASALAAPAPVEIRVTAAATELVISAGAVAPEQFQRDQCGALLVLPIPDGLDVSTARTGAGRIRGVGLVDAKTLTVATDCGAKVSLRRSKDKTILVVAAPPVPERKPNVMGGTIASGALATAAPLALSAEQKPVGPAAPNQAAADAAFARSAIAKGLQDAEVPSRPAPPKAPDGPVRTADATKRSARTPDPAWGTGAPLLDLAAWRQAPFLQERDRLRQAAASDAAMAADARRNLIRFQLAWDMAPEALSALITSGSASLDKAVAAAVAVMAEPTDPMADWLLSDEALRAADGPLWAAVLLQRRGLAHDGVGYLPAAARALPALPPEFRRELGLDLLSIAADSGLDGMAREIARQVESAAPTDADRSRLYYEIGRLHMKAGRTALALAQWDKAAGMPTEAGGAAAVAAVVARLGTGEIDGGAAEARLEETAAKWPGTPVEASAFSQLATLEAEKGQLQSALERLRLLHVRFPDRTPAAFATETDLAGRLLTSLTGPAGAGLPLAERILSFERSRELIPDGKAGWDVRRRYADMLAQAGVFKAAQAELQGLMPLLPAADMEALALDLAQMQLNAGDPAGALVALDSIKPVTDRVAGLKAQALLAAGDLNGALALVSASTDPASLRVRAEVLWRQERWADAVSAFETLEAKDSLTGDDAAKLALAGLLSGDAMAASRVLERHGDVLDGQALEAGLQALARPVPARAGERDLKGLLDDARAIGRLIDRRVAN